jgi:hypothetical protein
VILSILFILVVSPLALQPSVAKLQYEASTGSAILRDMKTGECFCSEPRLISKESEISISTQFSHRLDTRLEYALIAEIRDEKGITHSIQWQTGVEEPLGNRTISPIESDMTWQPIEVGNYQVRLFAISNFTQPEVLTPVHTNRFAII